MQNLDYKLWSQAPLLIASNEYGVSLAVGLSATRGFKDRGAGGTEELGINLGYNKDSRAFVFEIFYSSEKFKMSRAPVAVVGIPYKIGTYMAHRTKGFETLGIKGETYYPPMIPGFSALSPDYFVGGMSSSISIPPSPIVDMMTFTNEFDRNTILRITISPIVRGFVRIQIGDIKGSVIMVTSRVLNVVKAIALKAQNLRGPIQCGSVFN